MTQPTRSQSEEEVHWVLWSSDYFDRDSDPSQEAHGVGLEQGLAALWRKTLEEGLQDDGSPTFTWFLLRPARGPGVSLPRDPFRNPELARLKAWREAPGLIEALAGALRSRDAKEILAAAAAASDAAELRRRLGGGS